jgi:hypothetical protein
VSFLFTDGDNVQFLLNTFSTDAAHFLDPQLDAGKLPIGWTLSPSLAELAPSVLARIYRIAAARFTDAGGDSFVAGPSGMSYMYPDAFHAASPTGYSAFTNLTLDYLRLADMRLVNFITDSYDESEVAPLLQSDQVDGVILYYFTDYSACRGTVYWVSVDSPARGQLWKPVVCGRLNLGGWTSYETPASLAAKVNAASRDPTSPDSYTLVPVLIWTMNVSDIAASVALMDTAGVQVVRPDTFFQLMTQNVKHSTAVNLGERTVVQPPSVPAEPAAPIDMKAVAAMKNRLKQSKRKLTA